MKSSHGYRAAVIAAFLMVSGADIARSGDLPPDPGAAGATTLAGIDSDSDGLRDDVQRWIALNYPDSARWRAALAQTERIHQGAITQADDASAAWARFEAMARAFSCVTHIAWRTDETWRAGKRPTMETLDRAMDADARLRGEILNTEPRRLAYRRFHRNVPGGVLDRPDFRRRAETCDFDPEMLPD